MNNINTFKYYEAHAQEILKFQKIHLKYGIRYVIYHRLFRDCKFFLLGNVPGDYVKHYLQDIKTPSQFVIDCMNDNQNKFSYSTLLDYKNIPLKMKECLIKSSVRDSFFIAIHHKDYIEGFCLGIDINAHFTGNYLYKYIEELKEFIKLFKIVNFDIINNHPKSILGKFSPFLTNNNNDQSSLFPRYQCTRTQGFSHREAEIIHCIHQNLSNKEIAVKLNLSLRTVESYIGNIKNKTGFDRKSIKTILW